MKKIILTIAVVVVLTATALIYLLYDIAWKPNSNPKGTEKLIIPIGATFQNVIDSIEKHNFIKNEKNFQYVAKWLKFPKNIKPGKYEIRAEENNYYFIKRLMRGQHYPVKFTFNNIRTKEQFVEKVGDNFLFEPQELAQLLNDPSFAKRYGFNTETILTLFIPDSYEIYYDITAEQFCERLHYYYELFWNDERRQKADNIGLSPTEVAILASIVDEESSKASEKPIIAGLYLNRLKKGMLLQADPTVKFAVGDITLKRILYTHTEIDSPYNTYKYAGLPPGPLRIPDKQTLDAVLNYAHHNFLYMCAKDDLSGYHNFANTLAEHNRNAQKYHRAISRL